MLVNLFYFSCWSGLAIVQTDHIVTSLVKLIDNVQMRLFCCWKSLSGLIYELQTPKSQETPVAAWSLTECPYYVPPRMGGSARQVFSFVVRGGNCRGPKMTIPSEAAFKFCHLQETLTSEAQTQATRVLLGIDSHWFMSLWSNDGGDDDGDDEWFLLTICLEYLLSTL